MKFENRLRKLEGMSPSYERPTIIFLYSPSPEVGDKMEQVGGAILINCDPTSLSREEGESRQNFEARAKRTYEAGKRK